MNIVEYIKSVTTIEREKLGHRIGTSGAYIGSLIYKHGGRRNLPLAIEADKISNGKFNFVTALQDAYNGTIDWHYVRDVLNERLDGSIVDDEEINARLQEVTAEEAAA